MFSCSSNIGEEARKALFESALLAMNRYVGQRRIHYQEVWVWHTLLLLEYFAIYGGDDSLFAKARRIHQGLVQAMRILQMSQDVKATCLFEDSDLGADGDTLPSDPKAVKSTEDIETSWAEFIESESRKR